MSLRRMSGGLSSILTLDRRPSQSSVQSGESEGSSMGSNYTLGSSRSRDRGSISSVGSSGSFSSMMSRGSFSMKPRPNSFEEKRRRHSVDELQSKRRNSIDSRLLVKKCVHTVRNKMNDLVPCLINIKHCDSKRKRMGKSNDQVHVVKQGVLGLYIDNNGGHKIKKPKKFTARWSVLTRCEKTGQHTLHVCKTDCPDSPVKESFPVQTSWSIKSANCLKSSQRVEIFKGDGFILSMGRQVVYISCSHRNEVKSWMCAILEAATLGFEYHSICEQHPSLGVTGECMLVLSPESVALLCPMTGTALRKWPYFLLSDCGLTENTVWWKTADNNIPFKVQLNPHNMLTLYNVLTRYLEHTNPSLQVKVHTPRREAQPAENKYFSPIQYNSTQSHNSLKSSHSLKSDKSSDNAFNLSTLSTNLLYESADTVHETMNGVEPLYEFMSSNCSEHSTGVSSAGSTYDSDVYERMESLYSESDTLYEHMAAHSPTADIYTTANDSKRTFANKTSLPPRIQPQSTPYQQVYMNMEGNISEENEDRPENRGCYEYVDIGPFDPAEPCEIKPPQLPTRKPSLVFVPPRIPERECRDTDSSSSRDNIAISREQLNKGLESFQEKTRIEREMILSFSAAVLADRTKAVPRPLMNSTV